ncbi:MAG: large-conductance mechanosensitive channel protein MscL [Bacteroidota bacterium]|nr:large-conductance mechanosensitive channel protein MscL [Bacteroidota bacterium]
MSIMKEFKEFAMRGNMIDLAVGIVIGSAFGKIVTSLVTDIIMPPIGLLIGGVNFSDIKIVLKEAIVNSAGKVTTAAVSINFGNFIQIIFDFLIVAFAVFLFIKALNKIQRKDKETPAPAAPTKQEELLSEIRDLLKMK